LGSFGCKSTLNTENENSSFYLARGIKGSKIFGGVFVDWSGSGLYISETGFWVLVLSFVVHEQA